MVPLITVSRNNEPILSNNIINYSSLKSRFGIICTSTLPNGDSKKFKLKVLFDTCLKILLIIKFSFLLSFNYFNFVNIIAKFLAQSLFFFLSTNFSKILGHLFIEIDDQIRSVDNTDIVINVKYVLCLLSFIAFCEQVKQATFFKLLFK